MNQSSSTSWLSMPRIGSSSLKRTIQAYKARSHKLSIKLDQLQMKKRSLDDKAFVVLDDNTVEMSDVSQHDSSYSSEAPSNIPMPRPLTASTSGHHEAMIEGEYYHCEDNSLISRATDILIESVQLRLSYIEDAIGHLVILNRENPKIKVPQELMILRYEEWVQTNQRLFELNSQLYDLEKLKFDKHRKEMFRQSEILREGSASIDYARGEGCRPVLQNNARSIQTLLDRCRISSNAPSTTQAYLQEILTQRSERGTLEAQKVQEFVNECLQNSTVDLDTVVGAHPNSYQQFMAVLCNFIVERQREIQGEEIPLTLVYNTVEHILIPQIQHVLLRYVQEHEKDSLIQQQCKKFEDITLTQLSVKPEFVSRELKPFINSISQLKASYFSPTPTDKMSAVVIAAKALYDQLNLMGEASIDGDSFLDLWVYVIIKANIPELATNIRFMSEYGNPSLDSDEAGYYLTTLHVAASFIERLQEASLKKPTGPDCFVVCERKKMMRLSELEGSCVQLVEEKQQLAGYKVIVIKDWVLNHARLYCSVLLATGDPEDVATVSLIRFSTEGASHSCVEYFSRKMTHPQLLLPPLSPLTTPLGQAVTIDLQMIEESAYFVLDRGDYDMCSLQIERILLLIRLGSESTDKSYDLGSVFAKNHTQSQITEDEDYIYIFTPPQQGLEESSSITHRQLLQQSLLSQQERDYKRVHNRSTFLPIHTKSKSVPFMSSSSHPIDMPYRPTLEGCSSPYLISYSPHSDFLNSLPALPSDDDVIPSRPPRILQGKTVPIERRIRPGKRRAKIKSGDAETRGQGFSENLGTGGGVETHPVACTTQVRVVDESCVDSGPNNAVNIMATYGPVVIQEPSTEEETDIQVRANTLQVEPLHVSTTALIVQSNIAGEVTPSETELGRRFVKSDDFQMTHGSPKTQSHALKRWTERIRLRLSAGILKKKTEGFEVHCSSGTLKSPLLTSCEQERDMDGRESLMSKDRSASDRDYCEGVSGRMRECCVMVKVKDPGPQGFLQDNYVKKLKENFCSNHLFGSLSVDVDDGMVSAVKHAQMYLQHLNYLSVATEINGIFSDLTLLAVHKFQEAHNKYESEATMSLPQDGKLTSVTLQFLRQAFITVFASLHRLGALYDLGEEFDPTSTMEEDVCAFRKCVRRYQVTSAVHCHCGGGGCSVGGVGVLCSHTIATISKCLAQ